MPSEIKKTRNRRGTDRATMSDVAKKAQVSPSTVSLYLRQPDAVSDKLQTKIQTAIDALSYVPNRFAGSLAAASSRVIAVIIPSIANSFFARTLEEIQAQCEQAGYSVLLGNSNYREEEEERLVRTFLQWAPAAMIVTGVHHNAATYQLLKFSGIPVAQMWDLGGEPLSLQVGFDHQQAGADATEHLYRGGCQHVLFMGTRLTHDHRANARASGYTRCVTQYAQHLPQIIDLPLQHNVQEAAKTFMAALARDPTIDGVVCSNDIIALSLLNEAQRRNIAIPARLAVVGFGDHELAECAYPQLTSIRLHPEQIGTQLIRALLLAIEQPEKAKQTPQIIDVGFELIPRQTSNIR
ncbi:MAG: LacI family DNA-binding transcriptional regulator [Plesiomonas sp.]|uniref:LacI family DNA-binding transcriptional regulator n=1 Tax=Plesiomonas sp. TaxID=2486279 RepID=UPI003F2A7092